MIRTDSEGRVIWVKDYGEQLPASFSSVIQSGDDEYVILGEIASSATSDEYDLYLVKVDGEGIKSGRTRMVGEGWISEKWCGRQRMAGIS